MNDPTNPSRPIQIALGMLGEQTSAWFGALHWLNALVVTAAAAHLAHRTAARPPGRHRREPGDPAAVSTSGGLGR